MKTVPRFYQSNPETVTALQAADVAKLRHVLQAAQDIWYSTWTDQGRKDEGTCCGGKGIEVWYLGPRKRSAEPRRVIPCTWVQGNLSASRSVQPALDYLKANGIEASYDDGWMD
jgi:hypothetical protein